MPFSFSFLPKEIQFFDLFDRQAEMLVATARCFKKVISNASLDDEHLKEMRDLEHDTDEVTHEIMERLNRTFITPFDREDIHTLANEVDNIVDILYTTTKRMKVYKLNKANPELIQFADVIKESIEYLARALNLLRDHKKNNKRIQDCCIEVNRLENAGDQLRDMVIGRLFDSTKNTLMVIKWKEIFESAETALDICEDVANIIGTILVKQG